MAKAKTSQGTAQVKRKRWYTIVEKELFNAELGESFVQDDTALRGKYISVNLMQLTGDTRQQHIDIGCYVNKVENKTGYAFPVSYKINPSSIKRLVRRGRDRIDHSFRATTKDGVKVRVKFIIVTRTNTTRSVLAMLRKTALVSLTREITKHNYATLFIMVVNNLLTRTIEMELKKIYPLKTIVIRVFKQEGLVEASMEVDKSAIEELNSALNKEAFAKKRKLKSKKPKEENIEEQQIVQEVAEDEKEVQ